GGASRSVYSLPPCGGGLGRGGEVIARAASTNQPPPPLTPPQPKSDISDFGPHHVPNSGKPEFGWEGNRPSVPHGCASPQRGKTALTTSRRSRLPPDSSSPRARRRSGRARRRRRSRCCPCCP